jgi:Flp pilus assembly protein TadG
MSQFLLARFARDARGATAVEYALVMPALVAMILGAIWVGMLTFSVSSMDLAVQGAARCMAVDVNNCGSASATQTYAQSLYGGPAISPVFTASATGCGHTVTAQASFDLDIVPGVGAVPLSASACYP